MILQSLHPGDLVTVHGRYYRVVFIRGDWVTCRDVRHDIAKFHASDVELAAGLP